MQRIQAAYAQDSWFAKYDNVRQLTRIDDLFKKVEQHGSRTLVVPDVGTLRRECIADLHDTTHAGHPGQNRTVQLMQRCWLEPR